MLGQIRPDRQTLLFSATMPRKIQRLVADALTNPVHVTVGGWLMRGWGHGVTQAWGGRRGCRGNAARLCANQRSVRDGGRLGGCKGPAGRQGAAA